MVSAQSKATKIKRTAAATWESQKRQRAKARKHDILSKFTKLRPFSKASTSGTKRKNYRFLKGAAKFALYSLLAVSIGLFSIVSVKQIIKVRESKTNSKDIFASIDSYVIGIDEIPAYPGSEFIFKDLSDEESVKSLLAKGESAYRLPVLVDVEDVYEFYAKILAQKGWEHVNSVPINSEKMKYGEYWAKENDGIRIYSRLNDVWYEKLSEDEAKTGLSEEVAQENERDVIVKASDNFDFLPDFPWSLSIPSKYVVDYYTIAGNSNRGATITDLGNGKTTKFIPIGSLSSLSADGLLARYLKEMNEASKTREAKSASWEIVSSIYINKNGKTVLQSSISNGLDSTTAYVLGSSKNGQAYLCVTFEGQESFVKYLIENVVDKGNLPPNQDLILLD